MAGWPARRRTPVSAVVRAGLVLDADHPPRQREAPRGCTGEQRGGMAEMRPPIAMSDLVADEGVAARRIRNAQKCFGEAHQGDALGARQAELAHQLLDGPARAFLAQGRDEAPRQMHRRGILRRTLMHFRHQGGDALGFGTAMGGADPGPERSERRGGTLEFRESQPTIGRQRRRRWAFAHGMRLMGRSLPAAAPGRSPISGISSKEDAPEFARAHLCGATLPMQTNEAAPA